MWMESFLLNFDNFHSEPNPSQPFWYLTLLLSRNFYIADIKVIDRVIYCSSGPSVSTVSLEELHVFEL